MRIAIVGMGLAGTTLALKLSSYAKLDLYDMSEPMSSSRVAAGLVNPVTGRRFVYSQAYMECFDAAHAWYKELEAAWGLAFFTPIDIQHRIGDRRFLDDFLVKSKEPIYRDFLELIEVYDDAFKIRIKGGYRLDIPTYLNSAQTALASNHQFSTAQFQYEDLMLGSKLTYRDQHYDYIMFCEGFHLLQNPFFKDVPIDPQKGQVLIHAWDGSDALAYKDKYYNISLGEGKAWYGAVNSWEFEDEKPTAEATSVLSAAYLERLGTEAEIIEVKSAARPTTDTRLPFIKTSHRDDRLLSMNGLGTKGVLWAPVLAQNIVSYINDNQTIKSVHWK